MRDDPLALRRLEDDGLVRREGDRLRTTARFQAAMARAALRLMSAGDDGRDLRKPIAAALIEVYGNAMDDQELARLVESMLPVEARELEPRP